MLMMEEEKKVSLEIFAWMLYDEYIDNFECKKCTDIADCITCTAGPSSKCTECISTKKLEIDGTCEYYLIYFI